MRLCSIPLSRRIAYSYASCGLSVCANNSSAIFSVCMSLTHSSSRSPLSALKASSTKSAWNCSRLSDFFCFLQMKFYLSKATILVVTKISSRVVMRSFVVTVCKTKLGLFVGPVVAPRLRGIEKNNCVLLHLLHPNKMSYIVLLSPGL